jgi:hypothetical protein
MGEWEKRRMGEWEKRRKGEIENRIPQIASPLIEE